MGIIEDKRKKIRAGETTPREYPKRDTFVEMSEVLNVLSRKIKKLEPKIVDANKQANNLMSLYEFLTLEDTEAIYVYEDGVYRMRGKAVIKKWCQTELGEYLTTHKVNEIINHIRRMSFISREELEKKNAENSHLICVKNGILNLNTKKIKDHNSDVVFFNKLTVKYNPEQGFKEWEKFIMQIIQVEDLILMQKWFGYNLLRNCSYEKACLMFGPGGNGKTRILRVMEKMLGEENCSAESLQDLEYHRFARVKIHNKLANVCADISKREMTKTSIFKKAVSGERLSGERKGENKFEFRPYTKFSYSANEIPETYDLTDGFMERWILFRCPNKFRGTDEEIRDIEKKFTESEEMMSGILNWAIEGYRLLDEFRFDEQTAKEVRKIWIRNSDSVQAFIDDCLYIDQLKHWEEKNKVRKRYVEFCGDNGMSPKANNAFFRKLRDKIQIDDFHPKDETGDKLQLQALVGIKFKEKIVKQEDVIY